MPGEFPDSSSHDSDVRFAKERLIARTEAGDVIEVKLLRKISKGGELSAVLDDIFTGSTSKMREADRVLYRKLIRNSNNRFPVIGKPSSAFVLLEKGKVYLHFLRELPEHNRGAVLHDFLRQVDQEHGNRYSRKGNHLLSGHLAIITPEYQQSSSYRHVMLLDKFEEPKLGLNLNDRRIVTALHANNIVPITASDHPEVIG